MANDACEKCRFYDAHAECEGRCRVEAPSVGEDGIGVWPIVGPSDFCGKFEHRSEGGAVI